MREGEIEKEKIKSVNLASYQVSGKIGKEKSAPIAKEKKTLAVASSKAINKVVKCFFYKRDI